LSVGRGFGLVAILIMAMLSGSAFGADYIPLTVEEATAYMHKTGDPQIAQEIIKLDYIEHAVPAVTMPQRVTVLDGRDLVTFYPGEGKIIIQVGKYIEYRIPLQTERIKGFVPIDWSPLWWGIGGAGVGVVAGILGAVFIPQLLK